MIQESHLFRELVQDFIKMKAPEWRQQGRQEGRVEGRQEGRVEGRQEGRVEGRQEGRVEGRQEGRVEGRREMLLNIYSARFGTIPADVRAAVEKLTDAARLTEWGTAFTTEGAEAIAKLVRGESA